VCNFSCSITLILHFCKCPIIRHSITNNSQILRWTKLKRRRVVTSEWTLFSQNTKSASICKEGVFHISTQTHYKTALQLSNTCTSLTNQHYRDHENARAAICWWKPDNHDTKVWSSHHLQDKRIASRQTPSFHLQRRVLVIPLCSSTHQIINFTGHFSCSSMCHSRLCTCIQDASTGSHYQPHCVMELVR
jgi:hypothetical protein